MAFENKLKTFINKNDHYKNYIDDLFFELTQIGPNSEYRVYKRRYVYPDNIRIKHKNKTQRVIYLLIPIIDNITNIEPKSSIDVKYIIHQDSSNGIITVSGRDSLLVT